MIQSNNKNKRNDHVNTKGTHLVDLKRQTLSQQGSVGEQMEQKS